MNEPEMQQTVRPVEEKDGRQVVDLSAVPGNSRIVLPDGDIHVTGTYERGWGSVIIESEEGAHPTLIPPDDIEDWVFNQTGGYVGWHNIDIDSEGKGAGIRAVGDKIHVEGLEFKGRGSIDRHWNRPCLHVGVLDPDGKGIVEDVVAKKGSAWARYKNGNGRTFAWVERKHRGHLTFRGCQAEEFGNNAFYNSLAEGPIVYEDCELWNNNVAGIRASGEGCVVRNCVIGIDGDRYSGPTEPEFEEQSWQMRCFWVESKRGAKEDGEGVIGSLNRPGYLRVEDTKVVVRNSPQTEVAVKGKRNGGGAKFIDCEIIVDSDDATPVDLSRPGESYGHPVPDPPLDFLFKRTRIKCDSPTDNIVNSRGRDVKLKDCCLEATQADTGVRVKDGDLDLTNTRVVADQQTLLAKDKSVSGLKESGTCPEGSYVGRDPESGGSPAAGAPDPGNDAPQDSGGDADGSGSGSGSEDEPSPPPVRFFGQPVKLSVTANGVEEDDPVQFKLTGVTGTIIHTTGDSDGVEEDRPHIARSSVGPTQDTNTYWIDGALEGFGVTGAARTVRVNGDVVDDSDAARKTRDEQSQKMLEIMGQFVSVE